MDHTDIRAHRDDAVLWLTIDRPQAGNALTPDNRLELVRLLSDAEDDVAVRCVVITATGDAFCSGADLRASAGPSPRPPDAPERIVGDVARNMRKNAQRLITTILDLEKPVIAAVNGTAAGLGFHLALACDLVVASSTARFIEVFVRRGLVSDTGGAYLLPRLVGLQRAKELLFLGDDISAEQAHAMGLINRVVPPEALVEETTKLANRLAQGPTRAIALMKWLANRSLDSDRQAMFDSEAYAQDLNMTTHDGQEGVQAFVERRTPRYRGW
ncbi:MAG TPA: enoyl-CoA hydratase-related protein [Acidimicrobiales bacterium]